MGKLIEFLNEWVWLITIGSVIVVTICVGAASAAHDESEYTKRIQSIPPDARVLYLAYEECQAQAFGSEVLRSQCSDVFGSLMKKQILGSK